MTLGAAMKKAERREEWRELVARSSVAPQRSTKTTGQVKVKVPWKALQHADDTNCHKVEWSKNR